MSRETQNQRPELVMITGTTPFRTGEAQGAQSLSLPTQLSKRTSCMRRSHLLHETIVSWHQARYTRPLYHPQMHSERLS